MGIYWSLNIDNSVSIHAAEGNRIGMLRCHPCPFAGKWENPPGLSCQSCALRARQPIYGSNPRSHGVLGSVIGWVMGGVFSYWSMGSGGQLDIWPLACKLAHKITGEQSSWKCWSLSYTFKSLSSYNGRWRGKSSGICNLTLTILLCCSYCLLL